LIYLPAAALLYSSSASSLIDSYAFKSERKGFLGGSGVKASDCNAEDLGLIPGLGRSPGEDLPFCLLSD